MSMYLCVCVCVCVCVFTRALRICSPIVLIWERQSPTAEYTGTWVSDFVQVLATCLPLRMHAKHKQSHEITSAEADFAGRNATTGGVSERMPGTYGEGGARTA